MIRAATETDIPEIARLGERFHAQAGWGDMFDYRADDCAATLTGLIGQPHFICLVADAGEIVGMTAGVLT